MNQERKNAYKRIIAALACIAVIFIAILEPFEVTVSAAEDGQLTGEIITLESDVDAYSSNAADAEVVAKLKAGDIVLKTNETEGSIEIFYQGKTLYILKSSLPSEDDAALVGEMEKRAEIDKAWIESYVSQKKALQNARIWRIVIVAIIVVVVAVVVFISINRRDSDKEKASENG